MVYSFHDHDDVHSAQWFTPFGAMMMYTMPSGLLLSGHDDVHSPQWFTPFRAMMMYTMPSGLVEVQAREDPPNQAGKRTKGEC